MVPILDTATPQQARQFKIALGNPTHGAGLGVYNAAVVLIEDQTAEATPWKSTMLGTIPDGSPAVFAENLLGSTTLGGSGIDSGTTSENGAFLYQPRTGDAVMTAYISTPTGDGNARYVLMARASTNANAVMASAATSGALNFGTKLSYRLSIGAGALGTPGVANDLRAPRWMRLKRSGSMFTSETSTDGSAWTTLGSVSVPNLPETALWGFFHYSYVQNYATLAGNYQLATAGSVTLTGLQPPETPWGFSAEPGAGAGVDLTWTHSAGEETVFELERRAVGGTFTLLATLPAEAAGYSDVTTLPAALYEYRLRGLNSSGNSTWTPAIAVTTADTTQHSLPYRESFELLAPGTSLPGLGGWQGDVDAGFVTADAGLIARLRAYKAPVGFPLRHAAHAQAALFGSALNNRFERSAGIPIWCDLMVELVNATGPLAEAPPASQCAVAVDANGRLNVWHRDIAGGSNAWSMLAWQAPRLERWARVTLHLDYAGYDAAHQARYFRVFIDGTEQSHERGWSTNEADRAPGGPWFAFCGDADAFGALFFDGSGALDDLVVDSVRPLLGIGPLGVPEWWLVDNQLANGNSLAQNELEDADNDGFANWMEHGAGTDPNDPQSLLRITDFDSLAEPPFTLVVQTVPGRQYTLEGCTDLTDSAGWLPAAFTLTPDGDPVLRATATGETLAFHVLPIGTFQYYRVKIDPLRLSLQPQQPTPEEQR